MMYHINDTMPTVAIRDWPDHAVRCDRADGLAAIMLSQVTLAVWQRQAVPPVPDADMLAGIDDIALTLAPERAAAAVEAALVAAGYPDACVTALAEDIAGHAARFADLLDRAQVRLRLDVIEGDACRRFHGDFVPLRLICTYAGPGTQWLTQADAAALRAGADPATLSVRSIATGDVALFKGHDAAGDRAIVHRSPPIAGSGTRRLMLVIDGA